MGLDIPAVDLSKPKKKPRGKPFVKGVAANPNGNTGPNRFTKQLKEAILEAAETVGQDGKGKDGLVGFLIAQARKADNRGYMMLLGKVLPMTVAFDKNRPLEVVSRIELVRPEGPPPEAAIDVTPRPRVIDAEPALPPAPPAPVKVRAPGRSGA